MPHRHAFQEQAQAPLTTCITFIIQSDGQTGIRLQPVSGHYNTPVERTPETVVGKELGTCRQERQL